uniref:Uncharacterized protein n=1 Tax=Anopheles atroparvus TaxID=41427 RepID=A0AAG5CT80_ANOAO
AFRRCKYARSYSNVENCQLIVGLTPSCLLAITQWGLLRRNCIPLQFFATTLAAATIISIP